MIYKDTYTKDNSSVTIYDTKEFPFMDRYVRIFSPITMKQYKSKIVDIVLVVLFIIIILLGAFLGT